MSCDMPRAVLALYFDGELDKEASREFETHLDTCQACQQAIADFDVIRSGMRDEAFRTKAPPALIARMQAHRSQTQARNRRWSGPTWMALAASWLLVFLVGGGVGHVWNNRAEASNQVIRDALASHWRALAATSPVDVVSSDHHTVKPWFAGKVAESPPVKDFASAGFPLIGGRIDYVGDVRVPTLVYRHGKHLIDVFVFSQPLPDTVSSKRVQGYAVRLGKMGGAYFAIVSDMDDNEMTKFAALLSASNG